MTNPIQPHHYQAGKFDLIDFALHHKIGAMEFNVCKYLLRAGKKENNSRLQDLQKAQEYLRRMIEYELTTIP